MDLARQRRVEAIFGEAVAAREDGAEPGVVRERVRIECAGDEGLLAEVESLLTMHEEGEGLLDLGNPLIAGTIPGRETGDAGLGMDESPVEPGQRIGHYTVSRVLGSGGMGVVYVAEQERPRRIVALKVIRPSVASAAMLRRFEHEAEVLGRLHHPGIAQIYEAGTAEVAHPRTGALLRLPFLAMELVEGLSLVEFAERQGLSTEERLELVRRVCQAVQHAHQKGVIHRDLKPSNILVSSPAERAVDAATGTGSRPLDAIGQPKVLDFGVARVTDSDLRVTTLRTSVGQLIGTLPYMSPEQVAGDPDAVDIRSDVYAIGVILYQLLTGRLPHDVSSRSVPEAARMIRDEQPSRLSAINRGYRGEVEIIVAKAMEKDRQRRYQSAEELGEDIRRHLAGEAIQARRDSAMYVLRKQLRRYKWAVAAAGVFFGLVLGFAVYASVQATRQKRLAEALGYELSCSNIERGRALAYAGSNAAAETTLWREWLRNPDSELAHWALWEYYSRRPVLRSVYQPNFSSAYLTGSRDGSMVVLRGRDQSVQVWDGDLERMRVHVKPPAGVDLTGLAVSPDNRLLVLGTEDQIVRVYDAATGAVLRELTGCPERARSIGIIPGSGTIVCGSRGGWLTVWSESSNAAARSFQAHGTSEVWSLDVSPDGRLVASTSRDRTVKLWDSTTWENVRTIGPFTAPVLAVRFMPDSKGLLVGGDGARVTLYDLAEHDAKWSLESACEMPFSLALGRLENGVPTVMACGGSGTLELWDLTGQKLISRLASRETGNFATSISPVSGNIIAAGSGAPARVWEDRPLKCVRTIGIVEKRTVNMTLSPDGRRLVTSDLSPAVRMWDVTTGSTREIAAGVRTLPSRAVEFSPDGECLLVALKDDRVEMLFAPDWESQGVLVLPVKGAVSAMDYTADGSRIVIGTQECELCVVDAASRGVISSKLLTGRFINGIQTSPDGRWIAVGAVEPTLTVLDLGTLEPVHALAAGSCWSAAFNPSGSLLAIASGNNTLELISTGNWQRQSLLEGHSQTVADVKFSPNGRLLASCSSDQTIRLWDPFEGRHLATLDVSGSDVSELRFSPDGRTLYSCSADGRILAWDLGYYDRHIAGNLEYMAAKLLPPGGEPAKLERLRGWALDIERRARERPRARP